MNIDSVRSLKRELFSAQGTTSFARRQTFGPGRRIEPFPARPSQTLAPLALGIAGKRGDYKLAVRVQAAAPWLEPTLDAIRARSHGEIDVKYVGRVRKQVWHQERNRPLRIGGSIAHKNVTAGTLGCFVAERGASSVQDDECFVLSNNHVLADENRATEGDEILQPGPYDRGKNPRDAIGQLWRAIRLRPNGNLVDAAAGTIDEGIELYYNWLSSLGSLTGVRTAPVDIDLPVAKVGRTTGVTKGRISAIEIDDLKVDYDTGTLVFDNQIEIAPLGDRPFSLGGDSGSLIVDADGRALGLLFAGNDTSATFANPIQLVLDALKMNLVY